MSKSVDDLLALLARSRLFTAEEVRTIGQKWQRSAGAAGRDAQRFGAWLVAQKYLTEFQLDLLVRKDPQHLFLGDYKLLERIGRGRMAGVFRATHASGQAVAIKVLPPSKAKDPQTLARFEREARLALCLKHPNIVRTFQKGEARGLHFIVMEYLEGEPLDELLKRRTRLPSPEAARIVYQALQGLQHIHDCDMVHRDLKPGNLILVPAPGPGRTDTTLQSTVKILDIGLGRVLFDEQAAPGIDVTLPSHSLGVPEYTSPEQARDAHSADIRTDIYTLGCVLYRLLTGRLPFDDRSMLELVTRTAPTAPPARKLNPEVTPQLDAVLLRMLATDPARRFATPREAAQVLEPFLVGQEKGQNRAEWLADVASAEARPASSPAAPKRVPAKTSPAAVAPSVRPGPKPTPPPPARVTKPREQVSVRPGKRGLSGKAVAVIGGVLLLGGVGLGVGVVHLLGRGESGVATAPADPGDRGSPNGPGAPAVVGTPLPEPPEPGAPRRYCAVPQLTGQRLNLALQVLRLAELRGVHGVFYIAPDSWREDLDEDVVSMQSPQPQALVPSGSAVPCWTFARATPDQKAVNMPDVRGLSRAEAANKVRELGLVLMDEPPEAERPGAPRRPVNLRVADQYPRPNQPVLQGTSVFLQVP